MKWQIILGVLAGALVGVAIMLAIPSLQPSNSELRKIQGSLVQKDAHIQSLQNQLAQSERAVTATQAEQGILQSKIVTLEAKLGSASPAQPAPNPLVTMAMATIRQSHKAELEALKARLNLTPAQEAQLASHFDQEDKFAENATAAMFSGKMPSREDMKQMPSSQGSLEEMLKKMLTPEQLSSYEEFQKEEKSEQSELMAHIGMNEISSMFPLEEDQKDRIYAILSDQDSFKPDLKGIDPKQIPIESSRQLHEFLKAQLKQVLTPEQLEMWSKRKQGEMEAQQEMLKKLLPK